MEKVSRALPLLILLGLLSIPVVTFAADATCLAYGPGTGCTDSSGAAGVCNNLNVCVASGGLNSSGQPVNSLQQSTGGGGINISYLQRYSNDIIGIINSLIVPVLMAIAFLYFLIGVYKYFIAGGEDDRTTGRHFVLWGIIGFVVIFSVWGLVNIVGSTFNLSPGGAPPRYPLL